MHTQLTEGIISLSKAERWTLAKTEWDFDYAYFSLSKQRCLCGHYPIKQICVIRNLSNGNIAEVGNCCVKKFLGLEQGEKIFSSIARLRKDINRAMSQEALVYLFDKEAISPYEYAFYRNTIKKRVLTDKQLVFRVRINKKLLDFTNYEQHSIFSKINQILLWAERNDFFKTEFVESVKQSCQSKGRLSEKQKKALDNIIDRYGIPPLKE